MRTASSVAGRALLLGLLVAGSCAGQNPARPLDATSPVKAGPAALVAAYGKLPLSFEANRGQVRGAGSGRVLFLARGRGYTLYLAPDEAVLSLRSQESEVRSQKKGHRQRGTENQPLTSCPILRRRLPEFTFKILS